MLCRPGVLSFLVMSVLGVRAFSQSQDPDRPVPAREAPLRMTVPEGFKVTLFAGEPDVVQPIAFTFDDRGRLWVVECLSYPKWNKESAVEKAADGRYFDRRKGKDRVLIFEDTDGDGQHDKRTVFADGLTNLTGINYGFGGIWLCSLPNLLYIPIKEGEDKPAGPPEIKLDGWSLDSGHNAFNGIKWGPDGWLYGCNGITATSRVGPPGTLDKERTPMNCGVWRYHPTKKTFEVVAHGTTNPWGLDWDEYGELFITNCVIDHVWHVVPGGHYERMYGQDFNPHLYKLMPSIADHKHWGGGHWTTSRGGKGVHADAGGGHAHAGCMIYLGDNWPKQYRGGLFTCNLHGSRVNHDLLERKGSSYVARHGKDFLFANDPWFRGLGIDYGPDGGVYVSDWCDTGECHNYQVAHTSTGRIYKVVYGTPKHWTGDLAKLTDDQLIDLQSHHNEWLVRHARRLLQERASAGKLVERSLVEIGRRFTMQAAAANEVLALRYFWALHAVGAPLSYAETAAHGIEAVRAWALRLVLDAERVSADDAMLLARRAAKEPSLLVRLHLTAALQRLESKQPELFYADHIWPGIASGLTGRDEELTDIYLPLMTWYTLEPLAGRGAEHIDAYAWPLLVESRNSVVRTFLARRLAELDDKKAAGVLRRVQGKDPFVDRDLLRGLQEAVKGRRSIPSSAEFAQKFSVLLESPLPEVRQRAMAVAVQMGDEQAFALLRATAFDKAKPSAMRQEAVATLFQRTEKQQRDELYRLLDDDAVRSQVIKGLASINEPRVPSLLVERYKSMGGADRQDAIATLSSRPAYALALLDAVERKIVPRQDLNAFMVRQLLALNDKQVTARVNQVWGTLRSPSADKAARMNTLKKQLDDATLKQANLTRGRALYAKHCAACHKLFGEGGAIGPDLTGSQRTNLDYVLENMLDPSAVVPREYQVQIVVTASGRTITGIVKEETERALTLQTQNEVIILPKEEIESRRQASVSMMPEGVIEQLRPEELRDLVAYLASGGPLPIGPGSD